MALPIRNVPILSGKEAREFLANALKAENNPESQDYRAKAKIVREYLRKANI